MVGREGVLGRKGRCVWSEGKVCLVGREGVFGRKGRRVRSEGKIRLTRQEENETKTVLQGL